MGHIVNFDKEMRPFLQRRRSVQPVKPMPGNTPGDTDGYQIPFQEAGKSLAVQVVGTEQFIGISFRGQAYMADAPLVAKACEIINASSTSTIVANLQELRDFDAYFLGHLLTLLGTFAEGGRGTYLVLGSSGPCTARLKRLGIDQIIRSFPSTGDFYQEVGFQT